MSERELYIVEVDGFEGEQTRIVLSASSGASISALDCIAARNEKTGVLQFVDYGYETLEEARAAWPDAS